jgi:cobalt-zinc-cadmium efflux system membrane fusion protein
MKVRFPSIDAADKAGIRTQRPERLESAPAIKAFCESQYNLNAMARVTPLAGGVIHEVRHDIGDRVEGGATLVVLHSAEVASAKSDYVSALIDRDIRRETFEREKRLKERAISAEKEFLDAEAAYRTSRLTLSNLRQKLLNFGLTEDEIFRIEKEQDTSAQLKIRAPFDGTLVERAAVVGEATEVGHTLFTIADLSTHWLALSIPSDSIDQVRLGQTVQSQFPELPNATYTGHVTWVDTSVDPRSRMVRARALFTDRTGRIKAGLFGEARILTSEAQPAALVPRDAVQRHEGRAFVFVQNESDLFSLRRVSIGETHGDGIIVMAGLEPNEPVVAEGSFIVMSEFLKSRLGAGCVDE